MSRKPANLFIIINKKPMKLTVKEECKLIDFLQTKLDSTSRSKIQKMLKYGGIQVDGKVETKATLSLSAGQQVELQRVAPKNKKTDNEYKDLNIIYEDTHMIAVEKPAGMLSIDNENNQSGTFYQAIFSYVAESSNGKERIYIVHRLDREMSGIMLFAKSKDVQDELQENWDQVKKSYVALVEGHPKKKSGKIEGWLKENRIHKVYSCEEGPHATYAITNYEEMQSYKHHTLLKVRIPTAQKSQIRAHLSEMGCPIVGDKLYGANGSPINRLALHAYSLKITHPITEKIITFRAQTPQIFKSFGKKPMSKSSKPKKRS